MAARRRSKETVRTELERTRTRLDLYLAREQEMLSKDGVQLYTIGSRNLQRYQTPLTAIQDEIERLRKEYGGRAGGAIGPPCGGSSPPRLVTGKRRDHRLYYGNTGGKVSLLYSPGAAVFYYRQGGEENEVRQNDGPLSAGNRAPEKQRLRRSGGQLEQASRERLQFAQRLRT